MDMAKITKNWEKWQDMPVYVIYMRKGKVRPAVVHGILKSAFGSHINLEDPISGAKRKIAASAIIQIFKERNVEPENER